MPARHLHPVPDPDPWEHLADVVERCDTRRRAHVLGELSPEDLALVEYALARRGKGWRSTPDQWAEYVTGGRYQRRRLQRFLGKQFRKAATGESPRQIWVLPARYGKSSMASIYGPGWLLDLDPTSNLILVSYGDDLADENARAIRDLLRENASRVSVRLRQDRNRADRWVTTAGGGLLSAGIGSTIAGFGAGSVTPDLWVGGGLILDDPFKNWQEAHSPAKREAIWNAYRSVLRLRLNAEAAFILIVTTRWHEHDLVGKVEQAMEAGDGDPFEIVRLPALAEDDDPLGRLPGEPLDAQRFSLDDVLARHRALGAYLVAGMEQGRPAPEEGGELKRGWWQWYDQIPPQFDSTCSSWDMKLKDKTTGDFVVGQVWGRVGAAFYGLDQVRGQFNFATTCWAIRLMAIRWPQVAAHVVENTGNGPEVIAALRQPQDHTLGEEIRGLLGISEDEVRQVEALARTGMTGIVPETPKGSKVARARAMSPNLQGGMVLLPRHAEMGWALSLVNEAAIFPNGEHDDQVDAWSQALKRLTTAFGSVESPGRSNVRSLPTLTPRTPGAVPRRG